MTRWYILIVAQGFEVACSFLAPMRDGTPATTTKLDEGLWFASQAEAEDVAMWLYSRGRYTPDGPSYEVPRSWLVRTIRIDLPRPWWRRWSR